MKKLNLTEIKKKIKNKKKTRPVMTIAKKNEDFCGLQIWE